MSKRTHGKSGTPLYNLWKGIKDRCFNPNNNCFKYYGGRGITICPEWNDYSTFEKWALSAGYKKGLSIERINVNGNYEPNNCCWITMEEQHQNTSRTHYITYKGIKKTAKEWGKEYGISPRLLYDRVQSGYSFEDALNGNLFNRKETLITYKGKTQNITAWAKELGIKVSTISERLNREHLSVEEAFEKPITIGRLITYKGEMHNIKEWAEITGISAAAIGYRIRNGWDLDDVFSMKQNQAISYKKIKRERGENYGNKE